MLAPDGSVLEAEALQAPDAPQSQSAVELVKKAKYDSTVDYGYPPEQEILVTVQQGMNRSPEIRSDEGSRRRFRDGCVTASLPFENRQDIARGIFEPRDHGATPAKDPTIVRF
jgi:hypothetical protein